MKRIQQEMAIIGFISLKAIFPFIFVVNEFLYVTKYFKTIETILITSRYKKFQDESFQDPSSSTWINPTLSVHPVSAKYRNIGTGSLFFPFFF